MTENSEKRHRGVGKLFTDAELKIFFKKYLIVIAVIEVLIFLSCWFYQMGTAGSDRFGPVDIPFPWKTYFLVSFLTPVAVTFLLGLFIVAFNKFFYEISHMEVDPTGGDKPYGQKFQAFLHSITQVPFLMSLVLLAMAAGVIYRIDEIVYFIGRAGERSLKFLGIVLVVVLAAGTVFGLVWMVLGYKLKKRSLEYEYRSQVMDRLGLIFVDETTLMDREGNVITGGMPEATARMVKLIEVDKETENGTDSPDGKPGHNE